MVLVPGIITIIMKYPPSPYTARVFTDLTCLGRPEVFYDFDYFREGGGYANVNGGSPCFERYGLSWLICVVTKSVRVGIGSNLAEIYFLGHVLVSIKRQTKGIAGLLTRRSLEVRQRYTQYNFNYRIFTHQIHI
jgi:hypothetical protein